VAGIVSKHGVEGLFVCTLMAGVMLVILGATGMGSAVRHGTIRRTSGAQSRVFQSPGPSIRIRLLEVLTSTPERSVQDLQRTLGIDQPIVSQQLARLLASGIVAAKKSGVMTRYSVADPMLKDLLRIAKQILNRRLVGVESLLRELERDRPMTARGR
jgi:DNA-binding transcriptional ArsR family regulator